MAFLEKLINVFIGTKHERDIKAIQPIVGQVNSLEEQITPLSDDQLRAKTDYFRNKIEMGASLEELLPEAFAVVREASRRVLGMRHYDVQLVGGVVLHQGRIAEMKTGEGKTLVATLPAYLNALPGKGVHVVTVNDYLARRDADWMGPLYRALGLEVGVVQVDMSNEERRVAYGADITYGQNNEFGFDYLRDNMKFSLEDFVQRGHNFAIVDEVDSILIDEARTPLIISGPAEESTDKYYRINRVIPKLSRKIVTGKEKSRWDDRPDTDEEDFDYLVDEKSRTAALTERGVGRAEELLGIDNLYHPGNMSLIHHINQALKAHALFKRDVDYVVKDGEIIIVDEFTGRLMPGRRWSDGLHQAVEAKEGVEIARENQTLATVTFQNYFRMYDKLSGMTGTAETESEEFEKIYSLDVVVIPTNRPLQRDEYPDVIFRTHKEKVDAIVDEVEEMNREGGDRRRHHLARAPGAGGHRLHREERGAQLAAQEAGHRARGAQRQVPRAGGGDRRPGGARRRGHHRHQHGRPRHRHPARRQPRVPRAQEAGRGSRGGAGGQGARDRARGVARGARGRWWRSAACTSSAPSGTRRAASTTSFAAARGRQGDPGSSRFFLSFEDDLLRIFGMDRMSGLIGAARHEGGGADRAPHGHQRDRAQPEAG